MTTSPKELETNNLAGTITNQTISPSRTQYSQIQHRLSLLSAWFGSVAEAKHELEGKSILEIGCGQGDMTATLAHFVSTPDSTIERTPTSNVGNVLAVDPAPLDYGSPFTLGQAQGHLSSNAQVGKVIRWVQAQPTEVIDRLVQDEVEVGYVVLAHCLLYFESAQYLSQLLDRVRSLATYNAGLKVLVAEWACQIPASKEAMPHYLAIEVQKAHPLPGANVQTVLKPVEIKYAATAAGWKIEKEETVESPKIEDGAWEIYAARKVGKDENTGNDVEALIDKMEKSIEAIGGMKGVEALDVWTGVLAVGE